MILADTDVIIDYLAGVEPVASRMKAYIEQEQIGTTVITCFELLAGARESERGQAARQLVASLTALPLDLACAARAASVRQHLERAGQTIGMGDSLIAGIALSNDATLWTRNRKHFGRVDGLRLLEIT